MIVHLYNHPHHPTGMVVVHTVPDFYGKKPEAHPVVVKAAEILPHGAVRNVNLTFLYIGEFGGYHCYTYKEQKTTDTINYKEQTK